ncbi:MAG: M43 family zinc metalloprotease [Saprospiraceae bacterium]
MNKLIFICFFIGSFVGVFFGQNFIEPESFYSHISPDNPLVGNETEVLDNAYPKTLHNYTEDQNYDLCLGHAIMLNATTGSGTSLPASFNWKHIKGKNNGDKIEVKPEITTTYKVTITDAKKQESIQVHNVEVHQVLISKIDYSSLICPDSLDGYIIIEAKGSEVRYSIDGGKTLLKNPTFNKLRAGAYEVFAQDKYGCNTSEHLEIKAKPDTTCTPPDPKPNPELPLIRHYASIDYMRSITKPDTMLRNRKRNNEKQIRRSVKHSERGQFSIPIRIHVLYGNESQKLPESLLRDQIAQINADFSTAAYTKNDLAVKTFADSIYAEPSMSIGFCLNTGAINYHQIKNQTWTDYNSIKKARTGVKPIAPDQFLNIWICALPDSITGYAQMPWGPSDTDGIVIDHKYIGPINKDFDYNGGHSLTHLVGNYLGLYPLWGESPCTDDYVQDTPIQSSPSYYCLPKGHWLRSSCEPNLPSLINNFMDNTQDKCLDSFTKGQMARMMAVLTEKGFRKHLGKCSQ